MAAFAAVYAFCVSLSRWFVILPEGIAAFVPASGVLVACLQLAGTRLRLPILAVAALVNLIVIVAGGGALALSLGYSAADLFACALTDRVLKHRATRFTSLGAVARLLARSLLIALTVALAGLLAAAVGSALGRIPFLAAWLAWWLATSVSIVVSLPVAILLVHWARQASSYPSRLVAEAVLLGTTLLLTSLIVFSLGGDSAELVALRTYIVFPFFIWATVRFGMLGGTAAVLLVALPAMWYTMHGNGPFMLFEPSVRRGIVGVQIFCAVSSLSVLALGTILTETRGAEAALRTSENALRESRESLRLALDAGGMGTWNWDFASGAIIWSDQHATLFGLQPGEFDGRYETFARPIHPDDLGPLNAAVQAAIEQRSFYQHEYRVIWPDGSVHWMSGLGRTYQNAAGEPVRMAGTVMDVTARRAAEQELQRLNTELENRVAQRTQALEAANRDLESFSYSVSHDLRAPLRHIDGFVKLLTKREAERLDPTSQRYLRIIAESSQRMGQLIDDLLGLSRVGRSELLPQPVALNELVQSAIAEVIAASDSHVVAWQIDALPSVRADPRLLRLALVNLFSNAVKYAGTRPQPQVCVGALPGDEHAVTFFVRDNGVGFDMQYVDKLFGVFQRLHHNDQFEGTGIGLATVHRIVTRHGGSVRAEGEVDGGATFFVTLPRA